MAYNPNNRTLAPRVAKKLAPLSASPSAPVLGACLCILCILVTLWPGFAVAEWAALKDAWDKYTVLEEQGRFAEAEPFAREALRLGEKQFGPDDPTTAALLNNLARLHQAQGRYAEAEPLHKRALAIYEKAVGPEHTSVAAGLSFLAELYQAQGRYAVSLAILEKALGPEHPATILARQAVVKIRARIDDAMRRK